MLGDAPPLAELRRGNLAQVRIAAQSLSRHNGD
jgi:hypothetical protein